VGCPEPESEKARPERRTSDHNSMRKWQMYEKLKACFALLPHNGIDRNNTIAVFLMGALPAVGGSVVSAMLYLFIVWGAISLALRRFEFRLTRSDRMLAWTFTSFAILIAATALTGKHPSEAPPSLAWLLPFLAPWTVIPRLRASPGVNYLNVFIIGAAFGAIAAAIVAFVQLITTGIRPEAGAGNAAVFAIMSLCLMGLGGLNMTASSDWRRRLAIVAIIIGGLAVVLSMTRGVVLVVLPMLVLLAMFAPTAWRSIIWRPSTLLVFCGAGLTLYLVQKTMDLRWQQTFEELQFILADQASSSVGERFRLWKAALDAISQSPIWGYGIQNRMDTLIPILKSDGQSIYDFSHAHNGFLSFALDGGVFVLAAVVAVLCAPVVLAWQAPPDSHYRVRLFAALAVTGTYALCGLTQIMFKHDIMDSFFIFFSILVATSIPEDPAKQS